jgi:hypothetical protein
MTSSVHIKQIKIHTGTWKHLTELSTNKMDTFDSIINKCIAAYETLNMSKK